VLRQIDLQDSVQEFLEVNEANALKQREESLAGLTWQENRQA